MEVFKFNIIPTEEFIKREQFRKSVNNCKNCGAAMEFKYNHMHSMNLIQEGAQCPCCPSKKEVQQHLIH